MKPINPKIFKEYDIRGRYPSQIDEGAAYRLARAFIISQDIEKLAVARDLRRESGKVMAAFIKGAVNAGARVFDLGRASTPELFFAVGWKNFDGGAIATASHNPEGDTGFKLCNQKGLTFGLKTGLQEIKRVAEKLGYEELANIRLTEKQRRRLSRISGKKKIAPFDVVEDYQKLAFSLAGANKRCFLLKSRKFKLVLDASNGSGARLIKHIFSSLPLKTIEMNFHAGDKYPDHGLNPLLAASQKLVKEEVKKNHADLGVIWDGDADRCIFIDEAGEFVQPYYLNCLLAPFILAKLKEVEPRLAKKKIVVDARLAVGIGEVIKEAGGQALVHRSGYANIVKTMQTQKLLFGCENSGHYFFNFKLAGQEKNYVFGDTIIPVFLVLEYLNRHNLTLSQAISPLRQRYFISGEINLREVDFKKTEAKIKKNYRRCRLGRIDGLSVYDKDFFFNIRPSKTEPLVRLNVEARSGEKMIEVKNELLDMVTGN